MFFFNFVKMQFGEVFFFVVDDIYVYIFGDIMECMVVLDNVVWVGFIFKFKDVSILVDMLIYNYVLIDEQKMVLIEYFYVILNCYGYSFGLEVMLYDFLIEEFVVVCIVFKGFEVKVIFEVFDGLSIVICMNGQGKIFVGLISYEMKEGYVFFVGLMV